MVRSLEPDSEKIGAAGAVARQRSHIDEAVTATVDIDLQGDARTGLQRPDEAGNRLARDDEKREVGGVSGRVISGGKPPLAP